MLPAYRIIANGTDLAATIGERLRSLSVIDEAGFDADTAEITLADPDPDNPIEIPPTGAVLEIWMGYDTGMQSMGLFIADEIEVGGWPGSMTIRARAAPYETGTGGQTDLQTQKSRAWEAETTLSDMVSTIAQEHGLEAAVSESLQSITLPHYDQTEESDLSFLIRIARKYDAVVKPAGGKLMVARLGESRSASGEPLPAITLEAVDCVSWSMTITARDSNGTVVAYYHDPDAAERKSATVGSGDPVRRMRHNFPDQATAESAASAELAKRARGRNKFTAQLPGDPSLTAESMVYLDGFRPGIPTQWLVTRVRHSLTGDQGYSCELDAELPSESDAEVSEE